MTRVAGVLAPAKVNLALRVLGRRADGYHEVETLLQSVDLSDEVSVALVDAGTSLTVEGPDLGPHDQNLAYRAAEAFREAFGLEEGVRVDLVKRIPAGAGLGGGSSDAAAVLRCLAVLTGRPQRSEVLQDVAASLGSDVPFFLCGSSLGRGGGRGEVVEALPALPETNLVLSLPPVHVSTPWAYASLGRGPVPAAAPPSGPSLSEPRTWEDVAALLENDFQGVVAAAVPEVDRSLRALVGAGAEGVLLCGSGGASLGLFSDRDRAVAVAGSLTVDLGWSCLAVRTSTAPPGVVAA